MKPTSFLGSSEDTGNEVGRKRHYGKPWEESFWVVLGSINKRHFCLIGPLEIALTHALYHALPLASSFTRSCIFGL